MNEREKRDIENQAQSLSTQSLLTFGMVAVVIAVIVGCIYSPVNTAVIIGFGGVGLTSLANLKSNTRQEQNTERTERSQVRQEVMQVAQGETTDATHTLVNGTHGATLKALAVSNRHIAALTKDPADIEAAEKAERAVVEHDAKTAIVESQKKTG